MSAGSAAGVGQASDPVIVRADVHDVRFPTSRTFAGSDAMHPDPDYSAAYVVLATDTPGLAGHGLAFTIGRGNDVVAETIEQLSVHLVGKRLADLTDDMRATYRTLAHDTQLRWLGPEKGVMHLATAALLNAVWDLWARHEGKPLWKLLADLPAERIVRSTDLRYVTDVLTESEAIDLLERRAVGRERREAELLERGFPAYTTSAGWLGYPDEHIRELCREAIAGGWAHIKMKVGRDLEEDARRAGIIRDEIGPDRFLMMDANQVWDVPEAIAWMRELARFDPYWIEEPTSPDDALGHARIAEALAPIRVASGEHGQNRVLFKQFLQAGGMQVCQIDACRLGGVGEVIAVLLLAAKFDVPVCPHAGGVGLCEHVQHLAIFDYLRVGTSLDGRLLEYVDHLHEHFEDPVVVEAGAYEVPTQPGYSTAMMPSSVARFTFPTGEAWRREPNHRASGASNEASRSGGTP